jgi:hypothetical protein
VVGKSKVNKQVNKNAAKEKIFCKLLPLSNPNQSHMSCHILAFPLVDALLFFCQLWRPYEDNQISHEKMIK